jgi:predicted membrane protein
MNGKVTVALDKVAAGKAMSFSSMNGTIDVTLPADIKANLKMKVDNGDVYTDFDVKLTNDKFDTAETNTGRGVRVRGNRTTYGTINGGGP